VIESLVAWSVARRRLVLALTLIAALVAAFVCTRLRFDALPDVTTNQVLVLTRAQGLTPEEVERLVTRPIELGLGGMPGMVNLQRSISRYGISSITAVFNDDVDPFLARQMVQERLQALVERQACRRGSGRRSSGRSRAGSGKSFTSRCARRLRTPAELLELVGTAHRCRCCAACPAWSRSTPGAASDARSTSSAARGDGALARAPRRARGGGDEAATGTAAGASLPAGARSGAAARGGRPTTPWELAGALVRPALGGRRRCDWRRGRAALGQRRRGSARRRRAGLGETVYAMVQMLRGDNALQVMEAGARAAWRRCARCCRRTWRPRRWCTTARSWCTRRWRRWRRTCSRAGCWWWLVLFALLGSLRAGLLVALVIPLSMVVRAGRDGAAGHPGEPDEPGAIDFGLLVDGAVVMVEAVFCGAIGATTLGPERVATLTRQVARPVFFSVLVILLVYVPIVTLTGVDGKMFRPMAAAVIMALLASLVLALTFVPAAAAMLLRSRDMSGA
jgi:cobalt-zinc-cadmium resistance protein CzcA